MKILFLIFRKLIYTKDFKVIPISTFLFFILFLNSNSFSQEQMSSEGAFAGITCDSNCINIDSKGSDYKLYFTFSKLRPHYWQCANDISIICYKNSVSISSPLWFKPILCKVDTVDAFHKIWNPDTTRKYAEVIVGPSHLDSFFTSFYYSGILCTTPQSTCTCDKKNAGTAIVKKIFASCDSIKPPKNVYASKDTSDTYIDVKWTKGTDIPDSLVKYFIYRNDVFVDSVSGRTFKFRDSDTTVLKPGKSYKYTVTTWTDTFGTAIYESKLNAKGASDSGSTFTANLIASDNEFTTKTLLKWNSMSDLTDEIEVNRIEDGLPVQLAVVSKFATQYADETGIPGFRYLYSIRPVKKNATFREYKDFGTRKVNGLISGKVLSTYNAGVANVKVFVEAKVDENGTIKSIKDSAMTDNSGYYEINDIYYYKKAELTIYPKKPNHYFKVPVLTRKIDLENYKLTGIDFTDTSVFTISGKIRYPFSEGDALDTCGIADVQILLNGNEISRTNDEGFYAFAVQEEKDYFISPKFLHHKFDKSRVKLPITANYLGLNFFDIETDTIFISVGAGCDAYLADSVKLRIRSTLNSTCFDKFIVTDSSGKVQIILPAREYKVEVVDLFPINTNALNQIANKPIILNLVKRDSAKNTNPIVTYDSIKVRWELLSNGKLIKHEGSVIRTETYDSANKAIPQYAKFIYVAPLNIETNFEEIADEMVCLPGKIISGNQTYDTVPMLTKNTGYLLTINVSEGEKKCPIKEGKIKIFDFVSDKEQKAIEKHVFDGGTTYFIETGNPEIASGGDHTNQKLFYMLVEVGFLDPKPFEQYVFVTGAMPRDQTFATRSAGIPFIVLHDPPGDASYAYIEKGSSFSSTLDIDVENGFAAGAKMHLATGAGFLTPFSNVRTGIKIESKLETGLDVNNRLTKTVNLTFNERFSTTTDEGWVGNNGDVLIGNAFNMLYSLADVVLYDKDNCNVKKDTILVIEPQGFATTFIYTEGFIKESLIPRLKEIKKLAPKDSAKNIQADIDNWLHILRVNNWNRDSGAIQLQGNKGNISISHGASYESTFERDSASTSSYELGNFINSELYVGFDTKASGFGVRIESDIGPYVTQKFTHRKNQIKDTSKKITIGYHIEDNDFGDYHSIDILEDTANGVPAFRLVSGATECPHEENSQRRNLADIKVLPPILTEVDPNGMATYTLEIVNNSQSDETRPYDILIQPETNPDGAIVKIAGQNINFTPARFYIKAREKASVKMTVERGPLANQYDSIKIIIIAPCERLNFFTSVSADTFTFSTHFKNECSNIEIYTPETNWIHNSTSGNDINIALTGYEPADPNLTSIILQYRLENKGWQEGLEVKKELLVDRFYDAKLSTKFLYDGNYEIRAVANCKEKLSSVNYSQIISGKIDRKKLALFGTPYPQDKLLHYGEDIKIICDENINPNVKYLPGKIGLQRMDTKQFIPISYQIKNDQIIITTYPASLIDQLEGIILKATVMSIEDVNGNTTDDPIIWDFKVSRSPIYWESNSIKLSVEQGQTGKVTGRLKNAGITDGNFSITSYPSQLVSASKLSGTIVAGNFEDIVFTSVTGLVPGIYRDSIIAQSGTFTLKTYIEVNILSTPPGWINQNINPAKFEDRMNFVLQFSNSSKNDYPLSSDIKDVIGVFYKDSLRGKANIEYNPQLRKYYAYLTAYGNGDKFDSLSFRMWDAFPGIQYRAKESKLFKDGALIGQVNSPFILHPIGVYQTINLKKGWNWLVLFVKNSNQTPDGIFKQMMKDTSTLLKTQNAYSHFGGDRWYGNIDSLKAGIGYLLNSPKTDTIEIYGSTYGGEIKSIIEGNQNWSWVGNADQFGSTVTNKLSNLKASNNDIIIGETTFATFDGSNWNGSLNYLEPGSAYKIKTALPGEFINQKLNKTLPIWNLDFNGFEHNMNVTAEIFKGSSRVFDSHYLVGAFINGVCHGVAQPVYSEKLNRYLVFLTVFGDNTHFGQNITLKLFDTDLGVEIPQSSKSFMFNKESIYGSIPDPYDIVINSAGINNFNKIKSTVVCYPNPFNTEININLNIPKAGNVEVMITDAIGRTLESLHNGKVSPGNHTWTWDASKSPQGIYFCITKINGEIIRTTIMKK